MIAFIGSVFSPYYAMARRAGGADPTDHVACNVALYGVRGPGWAMTERNRDALAQSPRLLSIGASRLELGGDEVTIRIDERTAPLPRRLLGTIRLRPSVRHAESYRLDEAGAHRWMPLAPCARVEVAFERPAWRWSGHGYFDTNDGDAPLEDGFSSWEWSRATLADGSTAVFYDATRRDSTRLALARLFRLDGGIEALPMPPRRALKPGLWGMKRTTHAEAAPTLLRRLEDAPFYTRSLIRMALRGEPVIAVHESLSMDRFVKPWVQGLLPFRMPR